MARMQRFALLSVNPLLSIGLIAVFFVVGSLSSASSYPTANSTDPATSTDQWLSDVRLTYNDALSYTNRNQEWTVAASGDRVHVVWWDARDGNGEIYYKRSTNAGLTWEADTRLTNDPAVSYHASLAVSGDLVHVVWEDFRHGNYPTHQTRFNPEIYYKRSADGGVTWGPDVRLTSDLGNSEHPSITVWGSVLHVVWEDYRDGVNPEIYYKRSTDGGLTWGPDTRLTNSLGTSYHACVTASSSGVHIVWEDERDGNPEIYYKRSTDGGLTWGADQRLTVNLPYSIDPSISASGLFLHVFWSDFRDRNGEIYYKRSADGGLSWGPDTRLTEASELSYLATSAVSATGSNIHLVWYDKRDGNPEIYYKRSRDRGQSWERDMRLTNDPAQSVKPFVAASGQAVHVVWEDDRDGNFEIYYKRNPGGNP